MADAPNSAAREMAADMPRALNDPVGFNPSSLMYKFGTPIFRPMDSACNNGVNPSPRLT